jgi:tetratricopeptide (TPR) repeat protein
MTEYQDIEHAIKTLEALRTTLGREVVDISLTALRQRLKEVEGIGVFDSALKGERKWVNPEVGVDYCQQALKISQTIGDRENEAYALSGLGLNYEQLGHLDEAASNYLAALTIHREIGATTLTIFDRIGLARIALAQQNLETARKHITPVINWISAGNAHKFWDPWSIYQSTYQVLDTLGETNAAYTILDEAHTMLHQRAKEISDEELRQGFLDRVTVNREIELAWQSRHN